MPSLWLNVFTAVQRLWLVVAVFLKNKDFFKSTFSYENKSPGLLCGCSSSRLWEEGSLAMVFPREWRWCALVHRSKKFSLIIKMHFPPNSFTLHRYHCESETRGFSKRLGSDTIMTLSLSLFCMCVDVCLWVSVCVEIREQLQLSSSGAVCHMRWGLSLAWSSPNTLYWLPQGSACLRLLGGGL